LGVDVLDTDFKKHIDKHGQFDALFLHNAKTGGGSIRNVIDKNKLYHKIMFRDHSSIRFWKRLIQKHGLDYDSIFKFAFVRNPWERNFSLWFWRNSHCKDKKRAFNIRAFERWTVLGCTGRKLEKFGYDYRNHYQHYFTHIDGNLEVDFVGRFENYFEDLTQKYFFGI
jgi:hypothetical protein